MTTVVVPCFNESRRISVEQFRAIVSAYGEWSFVFVDDGSTDDTGRLLRAIQSLAPDRVDVVTLGRNGGKGEAVRHGMRAAIAAGAELVAFVDADLSTPLEELRRLVERLEHERPLEVVLGARVRRLGANVRRRPVRHLAGRVYGTVAAIALGVGVYDTQCGAKAFRTTPRLAAALETPFRERWAFDVELLSRLTRGRGVAGWSAIVEEPLLTWSERPGSKLRPLDALLAGIELIRIGWRHRRAGGPTGGDVAPHL